MWSNYSFINGLSSVLYSLFLSVLRKFTLSPYSVHIKNLLRKLPRYIILLTFFNFWIINCQIQTYVLPLSIGQHVFTCYLALNAKPIYLGDLKREADFRS